MDYEKIKELVIKEKWTSTEGRYGDDYRSLSIQIDNFIKHLYLFRTPSGSMTSCCVKQRIENFFLR